MGDYRSLSYRPSRDLFIACTCQPARHIRRRATFSLAPHAETRSQQAFELSLCFILNQSSPRFPLRHTLIPFGYESPTQHVLDTFSLTNHSPLTTGHS